MADADIVKPTTGEAGSTWIVKNNLLFDAVNGSRSNVRDRALETFHGPRDHGMLGWSLDPAVCANSTTLQVGVVQLIKVKVQETGTPINNVVLFIGAAGVSPTNCYAGIYSPAGARLGLSANQTNWNTSGTKVVPLTAPVPVTALGYVFVAVLVGGASTSPALIRGGSTGAAVGGGGNVGLSGASLRFATTGSSLTALPASITMSGLTGDPSAWFVGIKG